MNDFLQTAAMVWIREKTHVWAPAMVGAVIMANRIWFGWRLPNAKQTAYLIASASTLIAGGQVWWEAYGRKSDPAAWALVLGAGSMAWLAVDTTWKIVVTLKPKAPPANPEPPVVNKPEK